VPGRGGRVWQQAAGSPITPPSALQPILALVDELLTLFEGRPLDAEFALTIEPDGERLWLLQARPLVLTCAPEPPEIQQARLQRIRGKVARGIIPS